MRPGYRHPIFHRGLCSAVLLLMLSCATTPALSESFTGLVVGITDGDTVKVMRDGKQVKVRLHGIDTPERGQAFGNVAKDGLSDLIFQKTVRVEVMDIDRYGRTVGQIFLGETDINLEMVRAGLAWHYARYSDSEALEKA